MTDCVNVGHSDLACRLSLRTIHIARTNVRIAYDTRKPSEKLVALSISTQRRGGVALDQFPVDLVAESRRLRRVDDTLRFRLDLLHKTRPVIRASGRQREILDTNINARRIQLSQFLRIQPRLELCHVRR